MKWPLVPLGEIIVYRKEFIQINDLETYKRCRVQLHAQGIILRDAVTGAEIKTKKQQVCKAGDFLVAEIDAKVGGFGIVPDALEGAIVSSHYFLFGINKDKLERNFLDFFIRTPFFRNQVEAQGSTNYAAIRPQDVLEYQIPLPPLPEQQRIVARIEELTAKVEEAKGLRQKAVEEAEALIRAANDKVFDNLSCDFYPLSELTSEGGKQINTSDPNFYQCVYLSLEDIESHTGKIKKMKTVSDSNVTGSAVTFEKGVILFSKLRPYLNKVVVSPCKGCATTELVVFAPQNEKITPDYLCAYLRTPNIASEINVSSSGTKMPRANMKLVRNTLVPLPTIPEQHRIVSYLDNLQLKVDELKKLQAETQKELNALMPSILDKAFKGEL